MIGNTLSELKRELFIANEGLEQMQSPEAGYFENPSHPEKAELEHYQRDVDSQCEQIARMERKIARLEGKM